MANKEYELAIKIAGMIDKSLGDACNLTKKQLHSVAKEAASANKESVSFSSAMGAAGGGIDGMWNGATKVVRTTAEVLLAAGAAAGVAGAAIIDVGSDFESAFAGVKKTVNATDEQFADLEEGIREMAKNKPQTAVELSEIAEAAGQLGIHTENIEDFTSTMADLKVATNLGDEGPEEFAKFANIVGMSQDKFENLGSAVVALGNNSATTEADIMAMAMRLAGAGHQVGMTEADILGFAASLSSVGIEAEAGGSAVSKVMVDMQLAVEKGGESLDQYAKVAGMSSKDFKKAFKEDAAQAITAFISGLSDTDRLGESAIATLDDMDIKEVRLRDTLLRAANASQLFNDTLSLSSEAFEENTALTKEAEQRYATFESRADMVKNRIADMGITLYQDFRDPLSDALEVALQFTDEADLFDPDYIGGVAKNFQKNIPTVIRQIGDAKDAILDFAGPFIEIGDWMIENPDVIIGTLAGIGTTIVSLKLAQTVTNVATAIDTLRIAMMSNPITAAIGLTALAGGAIVGVSSKIKVANAELKKQKIESSFGDISLSLGELRDLAKQILGERTIEELSGAMDELGKVSDIANDLNDSSNAIRKLTWKVGMGFVLDDEDKNQFDNAINSMIDNSIDLIEQAQYTAHVNVKALFGDDETGQQLISGFDAMYNSINLEVSDLGRQLGEAYNRAMEDGVIDTDEAKLIQELQAQLARVTDQVAQSQLEAKLERIKLEYSGKELDADTFQNLQKEIQDRIAEVTSAAGQSFEYDLAALGTRFKRSQSGAISSDDAEYLSEEMYNDLKKKIEDKFTAKRMELELNGLNFQTDSITDAFSGDIGNIASQMGANLNNALKETINYVDWSGNAVNGWTYAQVAQWLNLDSLDSTTKDAIKELWENFEPQFHNLLALKKQYEAAGNEIPKSVTDGINNAAAIGIIAGSEDALWEAMGNAAGNSQSFQDALASMKESGTYIPEALADGINENKGSIDTSTDSLHDYAQAKLLSKFGHMTVYGNIDFNMAVGNITTRQSSTANPHGVVGHATGGIFDKEHLAWISEENQAEAIVPLDGSQHAKSIWQEAGEALGVLDGSSSSKMENVSSSGGVDNSESKITYSPVFYVYGGNEETMKKAVDDGYKKFETFMKQYQRNQKRLSF